MPTPSPVGHGTASCGLLVLLQENFPALTPNTYRCPSAGLLGRHDCASMTVEGFAFALCACVCVLGVVAVP